MLNLLEELENSLTLEEELMYEEILQEEEDLLLEANRVARGAIAGAATGAANGATGWGSLAAIIGGFKASNRKKDAKPVLAKHKDYFLAIVNYPKYNECKVYCILSNKDGDAFKLVPVKKLYNKDSKRTLISSASEIDTAASQSSFDSLEVTLQKYAKKGFTKKVPPTLIKNINKALGAAKSKGSWDKFLSTVKIGATVGAAVGGAAGGTTGAAAGVATNAIFGDMDLS